jgi:hypothetical protein
MNLPTVLAETRWLTYPDPMLWLCLWCCENFLNCAATAVWHTRTAIACSLSNPMLWLSVVL